MPEDLQSKSRARMRVSSVNLRPVASLATDRGGFYFSLYFSRRNNVAELRRLSDTGYPLLRIRVTESFVTHFLYFPTLFQPFNYCVNRCEQIYLSASNARVQQKIAKLRRTELAAGIECPPNCVGKSNLRDRNTIQAQPAINVGEIGTSKRAKQSNSLFEFVNCFIGPISFLKFGKQVLFGLFQCILVGLSEHDVKSLLCVYRRVKKNVNQLVEAQRPWNHAIVDAKEMTSESAEKTKILG